jgi:hypothetical protein
LAIEKIVICPLYLSAKTRAMALVTLVLDPPLYRDIGSEIGKRKWMNGLD